MNNTALNLTPCESVNRALEAAVEHGVELGITHSKTHGFLIDLQFRTKAYVYIILDPEYSDANGVTTIDRYDDKDVIRDLDDLLHLFKYQYNTKGFGAPEWVEFAEANSFSL